MNTPPNKLTELAPVILEIVKEPWLEFILTWYSSPGILQSIISLTVLCVNAGIVKSILQLLLWFNLM